MSASALSFYDIRHGDVCLVRPKAGRTQAMADVFGSEDVAPVQGTHLRIVYDADSGTLFKHGGDGVIKWQADQEAKGTMFELARIDIPLSAVTPEVLDAVNRVLRTSHCADDLIDRLTALASPEEPYAPPRLG